MLRNQAARRAAALLLSLGLGGCSTANSVYQSLLGGNPDAGRPERIEGFIGAVVADEPRAALAGREALVLGGSAADAAVATAFALAVTLPSRAGLGAGGACIAYDPSRDGPGQGSPEAILFTPVPSTTPGGDRPAAVPMLARGMFALHARYGKKPFEGLVAGAEQMARFGVPASRALIRDLGVVMGPLSADPNAAAVFAPGGRPLTEGATLLQPDLGATLAQLRTAGVGDFYQGGLARKLVDASPLAGGPIGATELRAALPRTSAPLTVRAGRDMVAFTPPPADGGLAAAAAFRALQAGGDTATAQAAAAGALSRWRATGGDPQAVLESGGTGGAMPPMGASTGFAVLDRDGRAVSCVLTMDNLFGTGRIAPGTGVLLAASPSATGLPLLSAALAWNANVRGFRAAVAGTGQEGAALATAYAMTNALRAGNPASPVPEPGRASVISCTRYLPGSEGACAWATDPRGAGLAAASN